MSTSYIFRGNVVGRRKLNSHGQTYLKVAVPQTMWEDFASHVGTVEGDDGEHYSSLQSWVDTIHEEGTRIEYLSSQDMMNEIRELQNHPLYNDSEVGPSMHLAVSQLRRELRKSIQVV